jgi:protein-S-isoprenylcysteine O-methyltransferase Ste14
MPIQRREGGYAALWVLIIIALLGVGGLAIASMQPDTEIPLWMVAGCVGVAAIGLVAELRYDRYEFSKNTAFMAAVGSMGCGSVAVFGEQSHPVALASAIALGATCVGCLVAVFRISRAEEVLPNALLETFDKSELLEIKGVQFATTHSDLLVPAGGELVVCAHAQNGMDQERTFEVRLKPRADIGKRGHLAFDKVATLALPPGAAGMLTIPVAVHPKARGTYPITVEPSVKGSGGERLRVFRAPAFSQKVGGGTQLLALFFGIFVWGGGLTLKLKVAKNKNWKSMPVEEASPSQVELYYEPDRALLLGARL